MTATERFLRYIRYETTSDPHAGADVYPSTAGQCVLLAELRDELLAMGLCATMDGFGYVCATLPANTEGKPTLAFLSHVDTSPAVSGKDVHAVIHHYTGGDLVLDAEGQYRIPAGGELARWVGSDIITTDGKTLLGADDKAGVAEIMSMLAYFLAHPEEKHGTVKIAFTPDEEIGRGTDHFDVAAFGADFGYTVDGGALGELEYENFNAAAGELTIHGVSTHPGSGKGIMKNAIDLFAAFHAGLPTAERPDTTEGYEGFYMADEVSGGVEELHATYILRDHDKKKFEEKKAYFLTLAEKTDAAFGGGCIRATVRDSYYNMKEIIEQYPALMENARAAMLAVGVTPIINPIRGGTDGARLSFAGLPCPNLSTGGMNFHSRTEYIPCDALEKMTEVLCEIVRRFAH